MAGATKERVVAVRRDHPWLNRLISTQEHYSRVEANQQAGAVTYFGFLSVFPILALAFFVVGRISTVFPDADETLTAAIDEIMPGLIGDGQGQIALSSVERFSGVAALVGLLGVAYAGLGWLSSLRRALGVVFERPTSERPNFVMGKLRDLLMLAILGVVLMASVVVTGVMTGFSTGILRWLGFSENLSWLVTLIGVLVGLMTSTVLFYALFVLLGRSPTPRRSLWAGAVLGAFGFEVLKQLSNILLALVKGQPAFQTFGTALILLVWINYFSRVILYAASFAHVATESPPQLDSDDRSTSVELVETNTAARGSTAPPTRSASIGGAIVAALVVVWRLTRRQGPRPSNK